VLYACISVITCCKEVLQCTRSCVQGLEATDDIITHQPLIEYIGNVMLRDQYDNGETSIERYVLDGVELCLSVCS